MRVLTGSALASRWWGYAEADRTMVGVLVATIAVLAVIYVVTRAIRARTSAPRARTRKNARARG